MLKRKLAMVRARQSVGPHWGILGLGMVLLICLAAMSWLGDLRRQTIYFLVLYGVAFVGYSLAVRWVLVTRSRRGAVGMILGLAVLFRLALLLSTPPTLSDDVYRYIWDGRLATAGVSPYVLPVNSPLLNDLDSALRSRVNNDWMASPYLPLAQGFFAVVYRLSPENPWAFQAAAVVLDLATGGLVLLVLRQLGLPGQRVLIYLWNPLVVVEFAHGAHVDALMLCLVLVAMWVLTAKRHLWLSVAALSAATLTKGLPVLLAPVLATRWPRRWLAGYVGLVGLVLAAFGVTSGWGLVGPLDGTGLFGALRIFLTYWNYNSGLYHWLEVILSGYSTPMAVPTEIVGWLPILVSKVIVRGVLGLVLVWSWWRARQESDDLTLLRLACIPLSAYLLLTSSIHPWYVTLIIPLLPFLPARAGEPESTGWFLLPGIYFSWAVALSYIGYMDTADQTEYALVRMVEYLPVYGMIIWAAWSWRRSLRRVSAETGERRNGE